MRSEVQVFPGPPPLVAGVSATSGWILGGISSVGRAPALQAGGHRFEPGILQRPAPFRPRMTGKLADPESVWAPAVFLRVSLFQRKRLAISKVHFAPVAMDHARRSSWNAHYRGQVTKGARWMPWREEAMKDVADCDKPRGAVSRLRSGDFRMGKPDESITHHSLLNS